jgi:cytochrome c oxidase subunit II
MNPQPSSFQAIPEAASTLAREVDALTVVWTLISLFFTVLIAGLIVVFMSRYRRRHPDEVGLPERAPMWLEVAWSVIPLGIMLAMFVWGTLVFYKSYRPPANAVEYVGIGKQWMWKFQHPNGTREINHLHVPINQPIRLTLSSEDVIHSFYVPAFRVKQDAVPGRYTSLWFEARKTGVYHLFCSEYCGTEHSKMIGSVTVMEPREYEDWLASGGLGAGGAGQGTSLSGAALFENLGCETCHRSKGGGGLQRGPVLQGVFGSQVKLADGRTVVADDSYVRESILNPQAKLVAGYDPVMPTFQGQVSEEQLSQLIAYVRSLGPVGATPAGGTGGSNAGPGDAAGGQVDANTPQTAGPAQQPNQQQ